MFSTTALFRVLSAAGFLALAACGGGGFSAAVPADLSTAGNSLPVKAEAAGGETLAGSGGPSVPRPAGPAGEGAALDEIAELERSGGFSSGLGLTESALREQSGDWTGAVFALFKELSWAYSRGELARETVIEGLDKIKKIGSAPKAEFASIPEAEDAARTALAFFEGRWEEARKGLEKIQDTEADSFSTWMSLVCLIENERGDRKVRESYSVIRARYAVFPEYWYRGARAMKAAKEIVSAGIWAERCVNLAASGPYSAECRSLIAEAAGLDANDGKAMRTKTEIENLAASSVRENRPEILSELFPLIALPDNPYTVYASGVLKALSASEAFRFWFSSEAEKAKGRLAERLRYICRG